MQSLQPPEPRLTPFFTIWTGQAFSLLGSSLVQFALIWHLTSTTHSATVLAAASVAGFLPQIVIGPFAGALVDRWNRRRVLIAADGCIALATAVLALAFLLHVEAVWQIYALLFIRALCTAFHWPAMQASTTLMIPSRHLARIGGMNQGLQGASIMFVPPLGALAIEALPMPAILSIDVATALLAILPLCFIRVPQPERIVAGGAGVRAVVVEMIDGARYLAHVPGMFLVALQGTFIRLVLSPAVALLPLLVTDHFGGGALQLAWLQTGNGGGLLLGGIILSLWGGFKRRIPAAMFGLFLDGLAIVVIGLAPSNGLPLAIGAFFASSFIEVFIFGMLWAAFQATIPPGLQGRLMGLLNATGTASAPLGLAVAGPVADAFGIQVWYVVGGAVTALLGLGALFVPTIVHAEELSPPPAPEMSSVAPPILKKPG